ncbi:MAG: SDR family oxidoreductase [Chloroflexi bacterium]|nr:SDR family oxidoreductase [Chloroflexota bacterium]
MPKNSKVALVTGASRGIGRSSALALAQHGFDLVVNYRSHGDEAQQVVQDIKHLGGKALAIQADVGVRQEVENLFDQALSHFGRLDAVVANAFYAIRVPFIEMAWADVQRVVDVTLFGVWHACQLGARQMVKQGEGGKIVIISSIHAEVPFADWSAYNMCKVGIIHLGATIANELAAHHINVNVINPGWIDTPGERAYYTEAEIQAGGARIPWGRLGTSEELGTAVAFLCSPQADYITGSVLRIDGGLALRKN